MEKTSPETETVIIHLEKIPFLFSRHFEYRMSDFSYGAWLIFEENILKYYFDAFHEMYKEIVDGINGNGDEFLQSKFKAKNVKLTTYQRVRGICLPGRSTMERFELPLLPVYFLL